jgi:hypothetical protein
MEYSSTNIIELAENQSIGYDPENNSDNAGEYSISLDKNLLLENGDQVSIKSSFIDTVDTSGDKIKVSQTEADSMSVTIALYHQNHTADGKLYNHWTDWPLGTTDFQDNKPYFLMDTSQVVAYDTLDSITFYQNLDPLREKPRKSWGFQKASQELYFNFKYTKPNGEKITININLPHTSFSNSLLSFVYDTNIENTPFPIKILQGSAIEIIPFNRDEITNYEKAHVVVYPTATYTTTHTDVAISCELKRFPFNFKIPAGDYDKSQLAKTITDNLSNALSTLTTPFLTNRGRDTPFMITTEEIRTDPKYGLSTQPYQIFGAADGSRFLEFRGNATEQWPGAGQAGEGSVYTILNGEADFVIGTDQTGLIYDTETDLFAFAQLHQDILDDLGANPSVHWADTGRSGAGITPNYFYAGRHGGVCITDFEPRTLWVDKMGFDPNKFLLKEQSTPPKFINTIFNNISLPKVLIIDGQNATNAIIGTNVTIESNPAQTATVNYQIQPALPGVRYIDVILLKQCYAQPLIGNSAEGKGYFIVEISGLPQNYVNASENYTSIQSIVSRYYQSANYTQSYGEGSITYIHRGEPKIISNFNVRILDPDKRVATEINNNSAIFLQLIKASGQPQ